MIARSSVQIGSDYLLPDCCCAAASMDGRCFLFLVIMERLLVPCMFFPHKFQKAASKAVTLQTWVSSSGTDAVHALMKYHGRDAQHNSIDVPAGFGDHFSVHRSSEKMHPASL
jgi:hypothetical protein